MYVIKFFVDHIFYKKNHFDLGPEKKNSDNMISIKGTNNFYTPMNRNNCTGKK